MQLPTKFLAFLAGILGLSVGGYYYVSNKEKPGPRRPHIVLIVADDMGWNDVSFHGANQIPTPNIDALAYNGVILNKHYVLPTCTPSRTSLMTSRYAVREGMQGWPLTAGEPRGIPLNSTLMPQYFRNLGYKTHLVGKWHLGYTTANHIPTSRGFDTFFGYYNGLITYFGHWIKQVMNSSTTRNAYDLHDDKPGNLTVPYKLQYFTDLITDKAEKIIKSHEKERPLFLEIAHLAVHASEAYDPLEVRNLREVNHNFHYINDTSRRKYAGMMKAMDESVGRVVTALSEADMLQNSIIIFLADNGAPTVGLYNNTGSNYPLRGIKNTLFEGGVRGAACIFSPLIKKASRVYHGLMHITDWLPTLYTAAGGNLSHINDTIDGMDQWQSIAYGKKSPRVSLLLNIDYEQSGAGAIVGQYKLIKGAKEDGKDHYGDTGNSTSYPAYSFDKVMSSPAGKAIRRLNKLSIKIMKDKAPKMRKESMVHCNITHTPLNCSKHCLFDLEKDPCETHDLSSQLPDVVQRLESAIEDYKKISIPKADTTVDPCSDPIYFNNTCMPWRENNSTLSLIPGKCQHPKYKL